MLILSTVVSPYSTGDITIPTGSRCHDCRRSKDRATGFTSVADPSSFYAYRPPSASLSSFFTELSDVLEMLVTYGCPVIIGGDLNVHVEDPADNDATTLLNLLTTFNLVQHVTGPTHRQGGTSYLMPRLVTGRIYQPIAVPCQPLLESFGVVAA